jgi:hypothetical protein
VAPSAIHTHVGTTLTIRVIVVAIGASAGVGAGEACFEPRGSPGWAAREVPPVAGVMLAAGAAPAAGAAIPGLGTPVAPRAWWRARARRWRVRRAAPPCERRVADRGLVAGAEGAAAVGAAGTACAGEGAGAAEEGCVAGDGELEEEAPSAARAVEILAVARVLAVPFAPAPVAALRAFFLAPAPLALPFPSPPVIVALTPAPLARCPAP